MKILQQSARILLAFALVAEMGYTQAGSKYIGVMVLMSNHDQRYYLQAHTDGELHASKTSRQSEETWLLVEVDKGDHIYALQNWENLKFMSKKTNGCAPADADKLEEAEKWRLIKANKVDGAVALQSVADGTFLGANNAGDDTNCGGEVAAGDTKGPVQAANWAGWWFPHSAKPLVDGSAYFSMCCTITPLNEDALLAAL